MMSDQQKWREEMAFKCSWADADRWFMIFIDAAVTWKKEKQENYRKVFFFFANICHFLPKYKKFALFFFYLICIIFLLKKFSCQPYFRDDGENQQWNIRKSIPTTEMTSLSIFQELFFFSERKKIDGNIFFRRISTTNIFFLFFLTDFKWLLPFLGKDFFLFLEITKIRDRW